MKAGFGRVDITPPVGVDLCGFAPYLGRKSRDVRDRLYARAAAFSGGGRTCCMVGADLIGLSEETVERARGIVKKETGIGGECVMFHATHTHSGPATIPELAGFGEIDAEYYDALPALLAKAAVDSVSGLSDAEVSYAEAACENIAYNRELEEKPDCGCALEDDWRPAHADEVDTRVRVIRVDSGGRMRGFVSSFACHPVVCCEETHSIHGDFCGVATNIVEKENPGSAGLFLQGAHGDVNSCVCHIPQDESMRALDVVSERYARSIRECLGKAEPLRADSVSCASQRVMITLNPPEREELERMRNEYEERAENAEWPEKSYAAIFKDGARRMLEKLDSGGLESVEAEIQLLRIGEVTIIGTPFELFSGVGRRVESEIKNRPLIMLSTTNAFLGYAPTSRYIEACDREHYASARLPMMMGAAPFAGSLEDEITAACVSLNEKILKRG